MKDDPATCLRCGRIYGVGQKPPCPNCGCRVVAKNLTGSATALGSLEGVQRRPGVRASIVWFRERTKLSALGKLARESLRFDRTDAATTVKTHRVEEQQPDGSWTVEHGEREEHPAKRQRRR